MKVQVTKEVAEAIEEMERNYISIGLTLKFHVNNDLTGKYEPMQTLDIEDLAKALINGYEIEKSPEEKVREYFVSYGHSPSAMERKLGVIDTLNLLGIKIKEVNEYVGTIEEG